MELSRGGEGEAEKGTCVLKFHPHSFHQSPPPDYLPLTYVTTHRYDVLTTCPGPYQTQNLPISLIPGTTGAPCYTRIVDSRGTINTPYHPKPYPENLDCIYEFVR